VSSWVGPAVGYLGYGRHGSCHWRHFDGDANLLGKRKFVIYNYWNLDFEPRTTINCKSASTQLLYVMH